MRTLPLVLVLLAIMGAVVGTLIAMFMPAAPATLPPPPTATPLPTPTIYPTPNSTPAVLPEVVTIDGVIYRAENRLQKSSPAADVAPVMLRPRVIITNTNDQPVEIPLEGCAARLRLYRDSSRSGTPVWDREKYIVKIFKGPEQVGGCIQEPYVVALEPGESHELGEAIDAQRVLNDGLPPGRYYLALVLALRGQRLELAAGDAELTYGIEGLAFRAETSVVDTAPRKLQVIVTVTNTSDKRVGIEYGACSVWLRAYHTPDRSGTPAWDERKQPNPAPCPAYLARAELGPGESAKGKELQRSVPEPDILGEALPDGRYYFAATVEVNGTSVEIPAGEAELSRAQAPLSNARTMDGLR